MCDIRKIYPIIHDDFSLIKNILAIFFPNESVYNS